MKCPDCGEELGSSSDVLCQKDHIEQLKTYLKNTLDCIEKNNDFLKSLNGENEIIQKVISTVIELNCIIVKTVREDVNL